MPRTVSVKLMADVSHYVRNIGGNAVKATRDLTGEMGKAAKAGHLDAVADRAAHVGLALTGMAGYAIKSAADFDKAMSAVSAATHASSGEISQLREAALQAGKDTQYSATGAADAITELSKAGVSTADVLGGGLKGALSLAAAGQLDVGEAAETAASAMTQFRLSGDKVPHIADLLAAAAGKAQGSVHDMGYALSQSGLVASQFGLSVEDTTGTLAAFASAGLTGSDAGTSFKTMLLHLASPSEQTSKRMDALGLSAYDAQGKFIGITALADQLREKLGGLTQQQRDSTLAMIFGTDAIRGANVLYQQGGQGIQQWIDKVNDAGYASTTAAKLTDNLAGDLERLKGSLETMAIEAGGGANGGLRALTKGAGALVDRFGDLPPVIGSTITVLAGLVGSASLVTAGWIKARRASASFRAELESMGPAGEATSVGLQKVGKHAARAGAAFAVLQVAGAALDSAIGDLNPQIDAMGVGMQNFASSGHATGEAARLLGGDMGKLDQALYDLADTGRWSSFVRITGGAIESIVPGLDKMDLSLGNSRQRLSALDQTLQQLYQSGNADQAAAIFQRIADRAREQGISVNELKKVLPGYAGALESAGKASGSAAGATKDLNSALDAGAGAQQAYKTAAESSAAAARGERDALATLSAQLKAETDPVFGLLDAEKKLADAQKAAAKATREHGKDSEQAKDATRNLALAAIALQGKVGQLGDTFDGKLDPALRSTLKAAGLTESQIKDVASQFRDAKRDGDKFAHKYGANVSLTGYESVRNKLDRLSIYQQALKSGKIPVGFNGPIKGPDGNYYAEGGWTGPGAKWDPAGIVHADEFVVNKKARGELEDANPGGLDYMNRTGRWPGYATGGRVWPYPATASKTRIPSRSEVASVVTPPVPTGGATDDWIVRTVKAHFPGLDYISKYRPGATTLTGHRSYHSMHRAVDWPANYALAKWWHDTYMARTKELITPWNELNIHNGRPHRYTGAVWRQHNFAGGNAHDHIAMAGGGTISEPVFGIGASGRTYSFGERGIETVIPGGSGGGGRTVVYHVNVSVAPLAHPAETGRQVVTAIQAYERGNGSAWRSGV